MNSGTSSLARKRADSPDPVDVHVGMRLRLRRNLLGLSQEQIGRATGLTFQQIQKYERGTNRMGSSRLFQLASLLSVPVSYFFEELKEAETPGFAEEPQAPLELGGRNEADMFSRRETLELIRAYYKINDPKQRRKVYELIKSMSDDSV